MHSTLRTELRGTQKVFELLRPSSSRPAKPQTRAFSRRACLRTQPTPSNDPSSGKSDSPTEDANESDGVPTHPKRPGLATDIEQWMNQLSQSGRSAPSWDSISQKDHHGKRTLLPQAKRDIEGIVNATSGSDRPSSGVIGFKVKDGRITQVSSEEIQDLGVRASEPFNISDADTTVADSVGTRPANSQPASVKIVSKDDTNKLDTKFYGSSSARRQRAQRSRDKSTVYVLPNWFHQRNVTLFNEFSHEGPAAASESPTHTTTDKTAVSTNESLIDTTRETSSRAREPGSTPQAESKSATSDDRAPFIGDAVQDSHGSPQEQQNNTLSYSDMGSEIHLSAVDVVQKTSEQALPNDQQESGKSHTCARPGGDDGSASSGPQPSASDDAPPGKKPILISVPDSRRHYHLEEAQHNELMMTVEGKLRQRPGKHSSSSTGLLSNHLLVHHAVVGSEIYLDRLVKDVASRLECHLISIDVQDIASLIFNSEADAMVMEEAKDWSYEVYGDIYKDADNPEDDISGSVTFEEMDEGDEDESESGFPGSGNGEWNKSFVIPLGNIRNMRDIFGAPRAGNRGAGNPLSALMPKDAFSNMPMMIGKVSNHIFSSVIDAILKSPKNKQSDQDSASNKKITPESPDEKVFSGKSHSTIVHIKDLKSIESTSLGKQFLGQLYQQVDQNRNSGDSIMVIGTEALHTDEGAYDKARIRHLQDLSGGENYTTLVITPVHSDKIYEDLQVDRVRRRAIINARHLWEALKSKSVSIGLLPYGFWTNVEALPVADQISLNEGYWSKPHIQRLSAVLASEGLSDSKQPIAEAAATIRLSDRSKFTWADQAKQSSKKDAEKASGNAPENEQDRTWRTRSAKIAEKANKHEKRLLTGVIEPRKIATTFEDIHIPTETIDALKTLTMLSLTRPDAFKYGVLASDRIPGLLLYGPPGTGKTLAAKAVARESGATMLEVSAADINDMYVGEGEKNVKALFSLAKKLSPCVVFLDEADAMFSARGNERQRASHRELLNQFLKEWDGMSNDSGSAFIMVATNRPMDLDDAVLRRLPRRVLVDLPTESDRLEILKIHLKHEQLAPDINLSALAAKTPFYSGSDLKNVAVAAALNAVKSENEGARVHTGDEPYVYPPQRTLTAQDFDKALEEISASISEDMLSLKAIKKFDEQYGDKRARKKTAPKWGFQSAKEADKVLDTIKVRS